MYKYKINLKDRFKIYLQNLNFDNLDLFKSNDEINTSVKSLFNAESILRSIKKFIKL